MQDDIRAISTLKKVSENQCKIISNASSLNGLSLNAKKTEFVAFSLRNIGTYVFTATRNPRNAGMTLLFAIFN